MKNAERSRTEEKINKDVGSKPMKRAVNKEN
jgi:hypothetical protein